MYRKVNHNKKFTPQVQVYFKQEDQFLKIIGQDGNQIKWASVCMTINQKFNANWTARQCQDRWRSFNQNINNKEIKIVHRLQCGQLEKIMDLIQQFGIDFRAIADIIDNRSYLSLISTVKYSFVRGIRALQDTIESDLNIKIVTLSYSEVHRIGDLMTRKAFSNEQIMKQFRIKLVKMIKSYYNKQLQLSNSELLQLYNILQQLRRHYDTFQLGKQITLEQENIKWNFVQEKKLAELFLKYGKNYENIIKDMLFQKIDQKKCQANILVYKIVGMIKTGVGIHSQIIKEKYPHMFIQIKGHNKDRIAQKIYRLQEQNKDYWMKNKTLWLNFHSELNQDEALSILFFVRNILREKQLTPTELQVKELHNYDYNRADLKKKLRSIVQKHKSTIDHDLNSQSS